MCILTILFPLGYTLKSALKNVPSALFYDGQRFFCFLKVGPVFCFQTTLRRTYDDAFSEDDDDEWVFDPALDRVMVG